MGNTNIEWCKSEDGVKGKVWNPVTGCSKVSEGCRNCYAERMAKRLKGMGKPHYRDGFAVRFHEDALNVDFGKKPRRIFVNSMSDLFHKEVPFLFVHDVMKTIKKWPQHIFQILTKRVDTMLEYAKVDPFPANVWAGASCENQAEADTRIPKLLQVPAAVRFVSLEPMLGTIELQKGRGWLMPFQHPLGLPQEPPNPLDWVICGGESGPGARPMNPDWVRRVRDDCATAGIPFFFKQWGEWSSMPDGNGNMCKRFKYQDVPAGDGSHFRMFKVGKKAAGRILDGRTWDEFPND